MARRGRIIMSAIQKMYDTLTGAKVNATEKKLDGALEKVRAKIDAERNAKEAEKRKAAAAAGGK